MQSHKQSFSEDDFLPRETKQQQTFDESDFLPTETKQSTLPPTPTLTSRVGGFLKRTYLDRPPVTPLPSMDVTDFLGPPARALEAIEKPGKQFGEYLTKILTQPVGSSPKTRGRYIATETLNEANRRSADIVGKVGTLLIDPKNVPFLIQSLGVGAVRPMLRIAADALFSAMQQTGAIQSFRRGEYADAAINQAFVLMGLGGLGKDLKKHVLKEAKLRTKPRSPDAIKKDIEAAGKLADETIRNAPKKTSSVEPTLIEGTRVTTDSLPPMPAMKSRIESDVQKLHDNPIRAQDPLTVPDAKLQSELRQVRDAVERNAPELMTHVDAAEAALSSGDIPGYTTAKEAAISGLHKKASDIAERKLAETKETTTKTSKARTQSKSSDQQRLVDSELFQGRGGPQHSMFGEKAVHSLDSAIEESTNKLKEMISSAAKGSTLGANLPLEFGAELAKNGAMRIAKGTIEFAQWSAEMVRDFGDTVRPMLHSIYDDAVRRVDAARDSGLSIERWPVLLSGTVGLEGKYVKNDPMILSFGKNDKSTGKLLREEFSGVQNQQIVRGNHFAQSIREAVPDALERQAMFWYKAARGDLKIIQEAIEHPMFKDYKAQLEKALHLSEAAKSMLDEVGIYYAEAGRVSRDIGTIHNVREEYQNRIYQPRPPQDFIKTETGRGLKPFTKSAKPRSYNTEFDAVLGGEKFAITDVADALAIHNEARARVNASRALLDAMSDAGIGDWVKTDKIPKDWERVGTLEKSVPIKDKDGNAVIGDDGNQVINHSVFAAPKGLAHALKAITQPDLIRQWDFMKHLQRYQGLVKTIDLAYSFFHHLSLTAQSLYQGNYRPLSEVYKIAQTLKTESFKELELDFARNNGMTSMVETNQDILKNLAKKEPGTFSTIMNLPGIKQTLSIADKNNDFLFGQLQRMLKVTDYGAQVSSWLAKNTSATGSEIVKAKRSIAREVNAAYGGLNWQAMGMTRTNLSALRTLLLAPDWTISNIEQAVLAFKGGPGGAAARANYLRAGIFGIVLTEGLNLVLTGHTTEKNKPGHWLEVEWAPDVYLSLFRGGPGDVVKYISNVVQSGPLKGTAQFTQGKFAPLPRTMTGVFSGVEYTGRPISPRGNGPIRTTADYSSYIARNLGPIPFSASNIAKYKSPRTLSGDILMATGIGRYAPRTRRQKVTDYLSSQVSQTLASQKISVGPPKQKPNESEEVYSLREELTGQLIDERIRLATQNPQFSELPEKVKARRIHSAIREAHKIEDILTKRHFKNDQEAMEYLRERIQRVEQRKAKLHQKGVLPPMPPLNTPMRDR